MTLIARGQRAGIVELTYRSDAEPGIYAVYYVDPMRGVCSCTNEQRNDCPHLHDATHHLQANTRPCSVLRYTRREWDA